MRLNTHLVLVPPRRKVKDGPAPPLSPVGPSPDPVLELCADAFARAAEAERDLAKLLDGMAAMLRGTDGQLGA